MADSPRWCATCVAYGNHHTDRHRSGLDEIRERMKRCDGCGTSVVDAPCYYNLATDVLTCIPCHEQRAEIIPRVEERND